MVDFEVNALGKVNFLEATRQHALEAVFALAFIPTGVYSAPLVVYMLSAASYLKSPSANHPG